MENWLTDVSAALGGLTSGEAEGLVDALLAPAVRGLSAGLLFPVGGFPVVVLWVLSGAVFFTLRMGFINLRGFRHAIDVVRGRFDDPADAGEVSHFQALSTAVSGTVGLGNIAGVAIAIQLGGPGAMLWLTALGFCGMVSKFVECTLGVKYRQVQADGRVLGGPMYYLSSGLAQRGLNPLGQALAALFALLCLGASLGGANLFQSNQAAAAVTTVFPAVAPWQCGLGLSALVALVIVGGIRRIGAVAEKLVPLMAGLYVAACLTVIGTHLSQLPAAVATIVSEAFAPTAVGGGVVGVIVQGVRRSAFSNEAGVGTSAIAHAAARTEEPVREGIVALLEPFIDTVVICNLTALTIVLSGVPLGGKTLAGVALTARAFATVIDWFPIALSLAAALFAFSTIISWSYYGLQAWGYLFGQRGVGVFKLLYVAATFLGSLGSLGAIIDFSDLMLMAMTLPNLLGCYLLSGEVAADLRHYWQRLTSGQMAAAEASPG